MFGFGVHSLEMHLEESEDEAFTDKVQANNIIKQLGWVMFDHIIQTERKLHSAPSCQSLIITKAKYYSELPLQYTLIAFISFKVFWNFDKLQLLNILMS